MPNFPPQGQIVTSGDVADNAISNDKLAQMAAHTMKGNVGAATADPSDCTFAQIGQAMATWEPDTIISSKVTSDNSDFFSVSGLTLTLVANSTDPFIYSIGNNVYKLTANATLEVTDNANNFIYIDNTGAMSRQATPATYAFTAPAGPASGDHWYDLGKRAMKTYNGSAWVASNDIAIGYVRADSSTINATYACEPIGFTPFDRRKISSGADGFLNVTSGTTTIDTTKNYTAVVVISTANIKHTASNANVCQTLKVQGVIALMGSSGIDLAGLGNGGAAGNTGAGSGGNGGAYGGGGGGGGGGTSAGGAGGSPETLARYTSTGGGSAGSSSGGTGGAGIATPLASVTPSGFVFSLHGNAGAGGGGDGGSAGANGGAGGGSAIIYCSALAATSGSVLRADGANGTVGGGANRGGGGGGGGGVILVFCRNYIMNGTASAAAGTGGGSGGAGSGAGGNGGAGVVSQVKI